MKLVTTKRLSLFLDCLKSGFKSPFAVADEDGNNIKETYVRKDSIPRQESTDNAKNADNAKHADKADSAENAAHADSADLANLASRAERAGKLETARTISMSGDVTGIVSFDGTKNVAVSTTIDAEHAGLAKADSLNALTSHIDEVANRNHAKRNTAYQKGDVLQDEQLEIRGLKLECGTAGTTGAVAPDTENAKLGDSIADGTVTWIVKRQILTDGKDTPSTPSTPGKTGTQELSADDLAKVTAAISSAKAWADGTESPDGEADAESPTGKTQSARAWALYAKNGFDDKIASAKKEIEASAKTAADDAAKAAVAASESAYDEKYAKKTGEGTTGTWSISVSGSAASVMNDATGLSFHGNEPTTKQPVWIWGGADANSAYIYKPENLSVKHAETAGIADEAKIAGKAVSADSATKAATADSVDWAGIKNAPAFLTEVKWADIKDAPDISKPAQGGTADTAKTAEKAALADRALKADEADGVDWTGVKNAPAFLTAVKWADIKDAPTIPAPVEPYQPTRLSVTLKASGWADGKYTVEDASIKADSAIIIGLPAGTDLNVYKMYAAACIGEESQADGKLVLSAMQTVPENDINVKMVIL